MNSASPTVSATHAIRVGFQVLCNHVSLLVVVSFAVLCERACAFYLAWTGVSAQVYLDQYRALLIQFATHAPTGDPAELRPFAGLLGLAALLGGLLLLGGFLMTGVLGLLRDLFLREGYDMSTLVSRGARYFWPIVRFKLPLYALLGVWGVALLPFLVWSLRRPDGSRVLAVATVLVPGIVPFFAARVLLSLGSKWIVVHDLSRASPLYGQVWRLVRPFLGPVVCYYLAVWALGVAVAGLPWGLAGLGVWTSWSVVATWASAAAFAVWARASALSLYLQLEAAVYRQREISPTKDLQINGQPKATLVD